MKTSQDIINYLIEKNGYSKFLEIGVRENAGKLSIDHIKCEHRDGVDIVPGRCNYTMTSDQFFEMISPDQTYDIIYIDGDHEKTQVLKDVENSLKHLNPGGTILCHDVNPPEERWLAPRYCNNCWEAWAELRSTRSDLEMYALNVDLGPGIIRRGEQNIYTDKIESSWSYLDKNRKQLLNEITVDEFKTIFGDNI
tara:strand:+ start:425 stop:1009 length:585 start_codon:yes stop_codon:yes gene_type:complete